MTDPRLAERRTVCRQHDREGAPNHRLRSDNAVTIEALALELTGKRFRFSTPEPEPTEPEPKPPRTVKATAARRAITECPYGHPYTPENTRIGKSGARFCRRCTTERSAARRAVAYWERGDGTMLGMMGAMG